MKTRYSALFSRRGIYVLSPFLRGKKGKTPSKKFDKTSKPRALSFGVRSLFLAKRAVFLTIRVARQVIMRRPGKFLPRGAASTYKPQFSETLSSLMRLSLSNSLNLPLSIIS